MGQKLNESEEVTYSFQHALCVLGGLGLLRRGDSEALSKTGGISVTVTPPTPWLLTLTAARLCLR